MSRGRPEGSKKREHAQVAAQAIWDGRFTDVRSAAEHFRPSHIGSNDGFRNFVEQVEEAYREMLETNNVGSLRRFGPLSQRSINRSSQRKPTLKYIRDILAGRN